MVLLKSSFLLTSLLLSLDLFARAGGGGGGGGGSGSGEGSVASAVIVGILLAIYQIRRKRMLKQAQRQIEAANAADPTWNEKGFKRRGSELLHLYQEAWMNKDLRPLELYFHPRYLKKSQRKMREILKGKKNILKDINLESIELMSILDIQGQEGDMFVLEMNFNLIDYIINEDTGEVVDSPLFKLKNESQKEWLQRAQTEKQQVVEYWVFYRLKGIWVLYNIHQVSSFVFGLDKASAKQLKKILEKERSLPEDAPVDDSFFYRDNE